LKLPRFLPLAFQLSSQFASQRLLACILNGEQDAIGVSFRFVAREHTPESAVRSQVTLLE
jgi:hypothetical protein